MGGTICVSRDRDQVGKAVLWLPWYIVNKFVKSVDEVEEKLGRPATAMEIFLQLQVAHGSPVKTLFHVSAILTNMQREDKILTDNAGYYWTTKAQEGFRSYS